MKLFQNIQTHDAITALFYLGLHHPTSYFNIIFGQPFLDSPQFLTHMASPQPLGVTGFIEYNGQKYDFSHLVSQFDPNHALFPASEGPRSIVTGNDEEQKSKYITAYEKTDGYVNRLLASNLDQNPQFAPTSLQLCQLTHCIHQTRQETDHVLTMVINKSFPTKRSRQDTNNSNEPATMAQPDPNSMSDDSNQPLILEEQDGTCQTREEIKRQRALDTTEYFSASEDEADATDMAKDRELVQLQSIE